MRIYLLMFFLVFSSISISSQFVPEKRVFAVLLFDTDTQSTSKGISISRTIFLDSLETSFLREGKRFYKNEFSGTSLNRNLIIQHLNNMKRTVTENDTILFYFLGHGGLDSLGHFLIVGGERIYRREIESIIKNFRARLSLIFTDSCSVLADTENRLKKVTAYRPISSHLITNLFFESSGVISVNSSKPNERSWTSDDFGAYFTYAFSYYLNEEPAILDKDMDGKVSWYEFLAAVDMAVKDLQSGFMEETKQHVFYYIMDVKFEVQNLKRFYEKYVMIRNRSARTLYVSIAYCRKVDTDKCEWASTYSLWPDGIFRSSPLFYRQKLAPFEVKYAFSDGKVMRASGIRVVVIDPLTERSYFWGGRDIIYDIANSILNNGYVSTQMETFVINVP